MKVRIKRLHPFASIPKYAKNGDAGLDLVSTEIIDESGIQITYGTGLAIEIPEGYVGLLFPRSSIRKTNLSLANSVAVIDSGYRGEIQVTFNKSDWSTNYQVGDKVVQLVIIPYPQIEFEVSSELSETDRGAGGFGHTGA